MKPKARIFLHHPECSAQSGAGIYEALSGYFKLGFFKIDEIRDKTFKGIDLVVFPGGLGDSDSYDKILRPYEDTIKNYVSKGGHYLGVCMGAYWAGPYYFNILQQAIPVQYIKRPRAKVRRSFGTTTQINWLNQKQDMFFYDGCSIIGDETKFKVIARYSNKDPMAIIQNNIGAIGCHPESMPSWYTKKFMRDRWHEYEHHKLLCDFAKRLVQH